MRYVYVLQSRCNERWAGLQMYKNSFGFFAIVRARKQLWAAHGFTWYIPMFSGLLYSIALLIFLDVIDGHDWIAVGAAHGSLFSKPRLKTHEFIKAFSYIILSVFYFRDIECIIFLGPGFNRGIVWKSIVGSAHGNEIMYDRRSIAKPFLKLQFESLMIDWVIGIAPFLSAIILINFPIASGFNRRSSKTFHHGQRPWQPKKS